MIKFTRTIELLCIGTLFVMTPAYASVDKGLELYKQTMRKVCGFSGNVMAKKHAQHEWKMVYEAGKLQEELLRQCPNAKPLKTDALKDMYEFLYYYASDSGNTAVCY